MVCPVRSLAALSSIIAVMKRLSTFPDPKSLTLSSFSVSFFASLIVRFPQILQLSLNFSSGINKTFVFYYCVNYTDRGSFKQVSEL